MPHDAGLEARIDEIFAEAKGCQKKKMFGGICFLRNGHMAFGIWKDHLIVRCGPDRYRNCLKNKHARVFDITGRAMTGWVMVAPEGLGEDDELLEWLALGEAFAATLTPK